MNGFFSEPVYKINLQVHLSLVKRTRLNDRCEIGRMWWDKEKMRKAKAKNASRFFCFWKTAEKRMAKKKKHNCLIPEPLRARKPNERQGERKKIARSQWFNMTADYIVWVLDTNIINFFVGRMPSTHKFKLLDGIFIESLVRCACMSQECLCSIIQLKCLQVAFLLIQTN